MITRTFIVKVLPGKRREFLLAMSSLVHEGEKEDGLRKSALYQEIGDQRVFCLIFEWETQEGLDRYCGGEEFRVILGALEILCEKSEIRSL